MSYAWGQRSLQHRERLHAILVEVFDRALELAPFDLSITDSYRGKAEQEAAFERGASKVRWPDSKHNRAPTHAGHLDPYPIDYDDPLRYYVLAGVVLAAAKQLGWESKLRWGGDWDRDLRLEEETFRDLAHWELIDVEEE